MRNYVGEALNAYYHKEGKAVEIKAIYEEAQMRFPFMHILIAMANTEAVKAIDMLDDKGMRRQLIKKYMFAYERAYDTYTAFVKRHMKDDAWALLQDYARIALNKIDYKCILLRQACRKYLMSKGVAEPSLLAQCEVAFLMWQIESDTFDLYFDTYKAKCGIDFRRDYAYADMRSCRDAWLRLINELTRNVHDIDFNDDRRCYDAWQNLKAELEDTDFFNKSAAGALELNPEIYDRYKDELNLS